MCSGRVDGIEVAEASLWDFFTEGGSWRRARLTVSTLGGLVRFLAALASLALVASDAGITATSVTAAAL